MMRSLWTAASGMTSQQLNVDTISHNLANVNTAGYKKERLEFKSLLYQTLQRANLDPANQTGRPVNLQVGHGVRPSVTSRSFDNGSFEFSGNPTDFAIEGDGFFMVQLNANGDIGFTRDGSFKLSVDEDGLMFVTSDGSPILSVDGEPIIIPNEVGAANVSVRDDGTVTYIDADLQEVDLGFQFALVQFPNVQGLEAIGSNIYVATAASGQPMLEADGETLKTSKMVQGYLEMSNVQVAEEMVRLIVAQRAYELNSKAIQTSDDMLQQANNLKR